MLYTSGSTGKPKGTLITHSAARYFFAASQLQHPHVGADRSLLCANYTFDASVYSIWLAWQVGAAVHTVGKEEMLSSMTEIVIDRQITVIGMTTTLMALVDLARVESLRMVFQGGEPLTPAEVARWLDAGAQVYNGYGPTECTIVTTVAHLAHAPACIPIGRPIANVRVHIVDPVAMRLAALGTPGELLIGGMQVGRGYFRRPELTARKYIYNAFVRAGERDNTTYNRMYRTGDLCRWLPDGDIDFMGRIDLQVKLRGNRIELGEIEAVLARHGGVAQCVVAVRRVGAAEALVAYVVPRKLGAQDSAGVATAASRGAERALLGDRKHGALLAHCGESLPAYMVPSLLPSARSNWAATR